MKGKEKKNNKYDKNKKKMHFSLKREVHPISS